MSGGRGRGRDDAGITIILMAVALVAILTVVALVLDLSNVRNTRQDNKRTTDIVTAAGAQALAPDAVARPWRGVCAALAYLEVNRPELSLSLTYRDGAGNPVGGSPCSTLVNQECVPSTPASWAWIRAVDGDFAADLRSGYVTPDADFPEDAAEYAGDNGLVANGGCDQLAVILSNADPALFGGIAGATEYQTVARSVARVRITIEGLGVPAFLMLERTTCDTLSEQVGSGELGIVVDPAGPTEPGIIHVDSSGSPATGCNGNNNPGGWTTYSSGTSGPKIVAHPAPDGTPGIIALHALQIGLPPIAYGGSTVAGLSPAPIAGRVVSRGPVDEKYNPSSAPTIATAHASGYSDAVRTTAPAGWATLSGGTCNNHSATVAAAQVFVNCPGGYSPTNATFAAATDVIFNGPVAVSNNSQLYLPAARRIVVGGNSNGGLSVAGGGRLGINSATAFANTDVATSAACTGREGPGLGRDHPADHLRGAGDGQHAGCPERHRTGRPLPDRRIPGRAKGRCQCHLHTPPGRQRRLRLELRPGPAVRGDQRRQRPSGRGGPPPVVGSEPARHPTHPRSGRS